MRYNTRSGKSSIPITRKISLPFELVFEILSWLPVESLLRFKCVSKQWYSLIRDPGFIKKHLVQSKPEFLLFEILSNMDKMHGEKFEVVSLTKKGLVLEINYAYKKYRIRNPFTRQILDLPDPQNNSYQISLLDIPDTCDFKVVSIYTDEKHNQDCEILTVGTDEQWRPLKLPSISNLGERRIVSFSYEVIVNFYFIRLIEDGSNLCIRVDALDVESECFSSFTIPQSFPSALKISSMNWRGHLAFAYIEGEKLNVRVFENTKKQKLSERKTVPLKFLEEDQSMKENLIPLSAPGKNEIEIIWFSKKGKAYCYGIKSKKIIYETPDGYNACKIQPNLITFRGMKTEKIPTRDESVKADRH
ncbi:F-box domain-containing protein [Cephalotus follicularis]|uniref:F-box domain-containing protein n=1 Tax=Cephalotus follicularis TaxID=3775 RepID=A0A1Q3B6N8_CEPFO|nr:F-box domain-containing protein [Cephalotus follicularis]